MSTSAAWVAVPGYAVSGCAAYASHGRHHTTARSTRVGCRSIAVASGVEVTHTGRGTLKARFVVREGGGEGEGEGYRVGDRRPFPLDGGVLHLSAHLLLQ